MADASNEIILHFLMLSLSAKGMVALGLVVPISLILIALAWRIMRR